MLSGQNGKSWQKVKKVRLQPSFDCKMIFLKTETEIEKRKGVLIQNHLRRRFWFLLTAETTPTSSAGVLNNVAHKNCFMETRFAPIEFLIAKNKKLKANDSKNSEKNFSFFKEFNLIPL